MSSVSTNLLAFDRQGLSQYCLDKGDKPFRAQQLIQWMHQKGEADFARMTNLSQASRTQLAQFAHIACLPVLSHTKASDGVIKWLFDAHSNNVIETVFIPETDRATLCISSQVGCAVGCRFCATGHQGFSRNLTTDEIIGQLWYAEHYLRKQNDTTNRVITNVVMMGMGEPLQNYTHLLPALNIMLDQHAYGLSRRRVTVSTSGVVPVIEKLAQDCPVALAVSLHAPNDELRNALVPLNRTWPLDALLRACSSYQEHAPRDCITFEYCMLDGVNDSLSCAHELITLFSRYARLGLCPKVNLIPFNPFAGSKLTCSPLSQVQAFSTVLQQAGIITTTRKTRGQTIDAACGQLAGSVQDRTKAKKRLAQASSNAIFCSSTNPS